MPVGSTAAGAVQVAKSKKGIAIAHKDALLANGLEIIAEEIEKEDNPKAKRNFTDFYIVSKHNGVEAYDPNKDYLTMVAITPHYDRKGLLAGILNQVAWHD